MTEQKEILDQVIKGGLGYALENADWDLDPTKDLDPSVPHAPSRATFKLSSDDFLLAIKNALRYIPSQYHQKAARSFVRELQTVGHIYMYALRPKKLQMKAYPIDWYPSKTKTGASVMVMITNNLDPQVAQFPHELVTYGGNGSVFSNWAQFHLTMTYLSQCSDEQTLVLYSGHPHGLFPSSRSAPRLVITNGMTIPNYSRAQDYSLMYALGVSQYGQMTAGSFCYIGPQGIVHGTTLTLLNAGRKYLNTSDFSGKVFVTSGLGGMSGAQPKAGFICNCTTVVAEVSEKALLKRHAQGWVMVVSRNLDETIQLIKDSREKKKVVTIGFHGNVVSLWERLAEEKELLVELGSDQTSCHNPFNGGYYPVGLTFEESNELMVKNPDEFKKKVQESLRRQISAINTLTERGMKFWDYGNSFLLEASRAGAEVLGPKVGTFRYPSYVQDIMGDIFSLGFGPFRWVCTSGRPEDLRITDDLARQQIERLMKDSPERIAQQYSDNHLWICKAEENKLVVGSQARILYSDQTGRIALAKAFNNEIRQGRLQGTVVLSRDHHDVSGTDSPWRETSNISDGSMFCADMSVQNFVGDSFRGASWVALHNGGGTGWGEAMNGGFGLVLDGSDEADERAERMLRWDVSNGVARRCWAGNENAEFTISRAMKEDPNLNVTMPVHADPSLLEEYANQHSKKE